MTPADPFNADSFHALRILAALILGGAIGLERELRDKPAGFRTIILICVGACLFTILSQSVAGSNVDPTRIAAQIVTGIGFLGAGAILHNRVSVIGLTTASTVWATAAIGMAAGFGHLRLAAFGTAVILVALWLLNLVEHEIGERRDLQDYYVATENEIGAYERIGERVVQAGLSIRKRSCYEEGNQLVVHVVAMGSKADHERLRIWFSQAGEYTLRRA